MRHASKHLDAGGAGLLEALGDDDLGVEQEALHQRLQRLFSQGPFAHDRHLVGARHHHTPGASLVASLLATLSQQPR